jgi:hypothetical protein
MRRKLNMAQEADSGSRKGERKAAAKAVRPKRAVQDKSVPARKAPPDVPEVVDTELVEKSVAFINGIVNDTAEKSSRVIGKHILETYFDNDPELARSHNPKKTASYAALQSSPDLLLSASSLNNLVRVEIQRDYLTSNGIDLTKLSYSHQLRLARLPDGRGKLTLAKRATEQKWSVRVLEEKVKDAVKQTDRQVPLVPDLNVNFRTNPSLLLGNDKRLGFVLDKENLKKLSRTKRDKLREEVLAAKATLDQYGKDLAVIVHNLEDIEQEEGGGTGDES